jgi:hypothetical protein
MHTFKGKHADRGPRWKPTEAEDITCHSCYMKLSDRGLPKGYESCTSVKEIASRKQTFESQPLQMLTARGLNSQSWKSLKTPSTKSRSFTTFRAAWNTPNEKTNIEEKPAPNSRTRSPATLEADMLEAKRQYQVARRAWELAQGTDSQAWEKSAADKHRAWLRYRRTRYAWRMANDLEYKTRYLSQLRESNYGLVALEARFRDKQRPAVRAREVARLQTGRANDPVIRLRNLIYDWVTKYPMARTMVDWNLFQPVRYSQKVKYHCQGCGYIRKNGIKLWWRSQSDTDVYFCHTCFIRSPDGGLPKAYKDCTTTLELNNRFKRFTGVRPKVDLKKNDDETERGITREP